MVAAFRFEKGKLVYIGDKLECGDIVADVIVYKNNKSWKEFLALKKVRKYLKHHGSDFDDFLSWHYCPICGKKVD